MKHLLFIMVVILSFSCKDSIKETKNAEVPEVWNHDYEAVNTFGDTLRSVTPSKSAIAKFQEKEQSFKQNPNLDNAIWVGRFIAYQGKYREAIEYYTNALRTFPNESRLLRHRGHRYISVREFDKAIADLTKAATLIEGKENKVEEDGLPNDLNISVSTMHGNIYYHLGLAHYLKGNMPKALNAYKKCLTTSPSPDNVVSASHWLYMIHRRMGNQIEAQKIVEGISPEMNVIENGSYQKACLFYKGNLLMEEIYDPTAEGSPTNSALKYAIGNWYLYNGDVEKAKQIYTVITSGDDWASFGYIAAEVDLAELEE